jgi:hypothetical protein
MSGPGHGLTRRFSDLYMVQEREAQERKRTQQALEWISRVLDIQGLPKDAWASLGDGVQLCRLVTALYPEKQLIKKYNPPNSRRLLLLENITNFLNACKSKDVGISAAELFEANDLYAHLRLSSFSRLPVILSRNPFVGVICIIFSIIFTHHRIDSLTDFYSLFTQPGR